MTGLNFREIFERVDRLYAQKQYAPAYALLTQGAERFPDEPRLPDGHVRLPAQKPGIPDPAVKQPVDGINLYGAGLA